MVSPPVETHVMQGITNHDIQHFTLCSRDLVNKSEVELWIEYSLSIFSTLLTNTRSVQLGRHHQSLQMIQNTSGIEYCAKVIMIKDNTC